MSNIDMDKLADEVLADLKDLQLQAGQVKTVKDVLEVAPLIVKKVEEVAANLKLAGPEKKALAVAIINKVVDIPWIPESAEAALISLAIDAMIAGFNRIFGKTWLAKVV